MPLHRMPDPSRDPSTSSRVHHHLKVISNKVPACKTTQARHRVKGKDAHIGNADRMNNNKVRECKTAQDQLRANDKDDHLAAIAERILGQA